MKPVSRLKNTAVTIGIIGSASGTGVTHFAIMLAGFLSSKEQKRTALIELNHAGTFEALRLLYGENYNSSHSFCLKGVDYYSGCTQEQLAEVFQRRYDYLIFDLGHEWEQNQYEWLRCSVKCIVGSCSEWHIQRFDSCIDFFSIPAGGQACYCLTAFGRPELKQELEKQKQLHIDYIPIEATPFMLHRKHLSFFERFL